MAKAASTAAKNELEVKSPSRVFYNIGDNVGKGFINALDDKGKDSYRAGQSLARQSVEGTIQAIGILSDAISNGIDTEPTIRPVLDLSDVTHGAHEFTSKLTTACKSLSESYGRSLEDALTRMIAANDELITERIGKQIVHNQDIPWASVRAEMRKLLDIGAINGGTDASVDPDDIRLPLNLVRVLVVCAKYSEMLISGLREELGLASPQASPEA